MIESGEETMKPMDKEFMKLNMRAFEVQAELKMPALDPHEVAPLLQPMEFKKLKSGKFEINYNTKEEY
jgi:hypothetical protein